MSFLKRGYMRAQRLFQPIGSWVACSVGLKAVEQRDYRALESQCLGGNDLLKICMQKNTGGPDAHQVCCIIFSMDRAIQLHALLCGYFEKMSTALPVYVLYRATHEGHRAAYDEVFSMFGDKVLPVYQEKKAFRAQLIDLLERADSEKIFFLVDDIMFTEHVDMERLLSINDRMYVPCLRLGRHLKRCYTQQLDQPLPLFAENLSPADDLLTWRWAEGALDWGYPLSVDGNIFYRDEILALAKNVDFSNPNQFEGHLQIFSELYNFRYGVCFEKSSIVNIPVNRVQSEYRNVHGDIHQDDLLGKWNEGYCIDYRALYGFVNESAHQEVSIGFVRR